MADIAQIIADIQAFTPSQDYQNYSGDQNLRKLFNAAAYSPDSAQAVPVMLDIITKYPETHFHFPHLVNALEQCTNYEVLTIQAAQESPTPLNIIAINHLRSRPPFNYDDLTRIIEQSLGHPQASATTKEFAQAILKVRPLEQIIADFKAFTPSQNDYNYMGREKLWTLCHELMDTPDPKPAIPVILSIIERYPEEDFGTPGVLVHTLEQIPGAQFWVMQSAKRAPVPLNLEMIYRLWNVPTALPEERADYVQLLEAALTHPQAPPVAKEAAQNFLDYVAEYSSKK